VIVFPEEPGASTGKVGRFKKGSFVVAVDAGLPVVPVSVPAVVTS
jgi:1-acyl-sn-glycerol-3-phosphate acyltransferase